MGKTARVESVEALRNFRRALWKYAESANVAISDADSDVGKTMGWLEREQSTYWQNQLRKRTEMLNRAKEALRQKQIYRDSSGRLPPADEEKKEVARCTRAIEEAQTKIVAVQRSIRRLQKEQMAYKGQIQRLATLVNGDIPAAVAKLDNLSLALEAYIGFGPATAGSTADQGSTAGGMARGSTEEKQVEEQPSDIDWAALRLRVPGSSRREAAVAADMALLSKVLIPDETSAAVLLGLPREVIDGELRVTVSPSVAGAPALAWVRTDPYSADDSGWHLLPTISEDNETTALAAFTVAEVSGLSHVIAGILALPVGTGCLVANDGKAVSIVSIVDAGNNSITRIPSVPVESEISAEEGLPSAAAESK